MKIYNKARIPTAVLRPLLLAAARYARMHPNIVVKVTRRQRPWVSGMAQRANVVYKWHLRKSRSDKNRYDGVPTHAGWYHLVLPGNHPAYDSLDLARRVFEVMIHESAHVADYQAMARGEHRLFSSRNPQSGRRIKHDNRPEERRAEVVVENAIFDGALRRNQDAIIALALAIETR